MAQAASIKHARFALLDGSRNLFLLVPVVGEHARREFQIIEVNAVLAAMAVVFYDVPWFGTPNFALNLSQVSQ